MVHDWIAIEAVLRDEHMPSRDVEAALRRAVTPCPVCDGYHVPGKLAASASDHRYRDWWHEWLTIETHDDSWRTRLLTIADSFARELGCRNGR